MSPPPPQSAPSTAATTNETVNGEEIKKSTKRLAPQPPVASNNNNNNKMYSKEVSSEKIEKVCETVLEVPKNEDQMKMNDVNVDKVNNEQNTLKQVDETDIKMDNNSTLLKNNSNDKLTNDTIIFNCDSMNNSIKDDDQCHSPKQSVFDDGDSALKMVENGQHQDNNCQVTILSNHSTIINTVDVPDDQKNISIVTIEDSKNISIKSFDDHLGQNNNNKRDRKSESPKIVLNNEYAGSGQKSLEISKPKKDAPKQVNNVNNKPLNDNSNNNKAIRTDSSNSKKTTIKVNLNLKSDNVQKNCNTKVNTKTDANNYLTRIDQANSISQIIPNARHNNKINENKSLKRESSNSSSNFGSVGSDKENKMHNLSPDQSAVIIRKKQDMVCLV